MNINTFTEKAQEALAASQQLAERSNHAQIEPEHLLVALAEQTAGVVPEVLRKMGANPADVAKASRDQRNISGSSMFPLLAEKSIAPVNSAECAASLNGKRRISAVRYAFADFR